MARESHSSSHEAPFPITDKNPKFSFSPRSTHLFQSNTTHHTATKAHRQRSHLGIAHIGSAIGRVISDDNGDYHDVDDGDSGSDPSSDSSSGSDSDNSSTSTEKRNRKSRHVYDKSHNQSHQKYDKSHVKGHQTHDKSHVNSRSTTHESYGETSLSSNGALNTANDPDEDDQNRRSSWSDHVATCPSCSNLPGIGSSRPSTLRATSSSTAVYSGYKARRSNPTIDAIARTLTSPRASIAPEASYLVDSNGALEDHVSPTNDTITSSAQAKDSPALVPTQIIDVRRPDGSIVQVDGTIVTIRQCNEPISSPTTVSFNWATTNSSRSSSRKVYRNPKVTKTKRGESKHRTDPNDREDAVTHEKSRLYEDYTGKLEPEVTVHESVENSCDSCGGSYKRGSGAQVLTRRTSRFIQIMIWIIMIIIPLLFIALGILNAIINGKSNNDDSEIAYVGNSVAQANEVAVTIWPIVFAAMIAQSLRMYASYRAERGISLMTLEQLIGSHSVASAIKQPFIFRRPDWTTLILLCLWSLSPLAGQAFLRMSSTGYTHTQKFQTTQYVNVSGQSTVFGTNDDNNLTIAFRDGAPNVNLLFGSSIIGSDASKGAPWDSWGNARIPTFEKLLADSNTTNSTEWRSTDESLSAADEDDEPFLGLSSFSSSVFSSFLGVPIIGLPYTQGDSNSYPRRDLTVQSSYFLFDCQNFEIVPNAPSNTTVANTTDVTFYPSKSETLYMSLSPIQSGKPGSLNFYSRIQQNVSDDSGQYAYTSCSFNQSFVESVVSCTEDGCAVQKMRPVIASTSYTTDADAFQNMLSAWAAFGGDENSFQYTPTELFLNDPTTVDRYVQALDLSQVDISAFTDRMTLLFNTYWQAGVAPFDFGGGTHDPTDTTDPLLEDPNAIQTTYAQVFHTNWAWLAVALFASVILLIAGIAGAIWDSRTVGPSFFGYASSLLPRKSKYIRLNGGGGAVGGPALARALSNTQVMLQDVRPDRQVGKIALATVDGRGQKLKLGRRYK